MELTQPCFITMKMVNSKMTNRQPNYQDLFLLLLSLGFQEKRRERASSQYSVFFHQQTDTILAFARPIDEPITPADMLSTEVHLQAKGITDQALDALLTLGPVVVR